MGGAEWSAGGCRSSSAIVGCHSRIHPLPTGGLQTERGLRRTDDALEYRNLRERKKKKTRACSFLPELERVSPDKSAKSIRRTNITNEIMKCEEKCKRENADLKAEA